MITPLLYKKIPPSSQKKGDGGTFLFVLIQSLGPGVGEGVGADVFLLVLFFHVVLHIALGGAAAFFFELLVETVKFFAEATSAAVDAFVAIADHR